MEISDSNFLRLKSRQIIITKKQHEALLGICLGDGHIELAKNGQSASLKICQSLTHKFYVEHLRELFPIQSWGGLPVKDRQRVDLPSRNWISEFSSKVSPSLLWYRKLFYDDNGHKRIPRFINNEFTARSVSYLYMDDGGIKSSDSKGVFINTYNDFPENDQWTFCEYLKSNFRLDANVVFDRLNPRIFISGKSYETLAFILKDRMLLGFANKLPGPRKGKGAWRAKEVSKEILTNHSIEVDLLSANKPLNLKELDLFKRYYINLPDYD